MRLGKSDLLAIICCAALLGSNSARAAAQATNSLLYPIDLPTTLQLAGAQNLEVQLARERLNEARAEYASALERFFPWIAPGFTYHRRDGVAQAVPAGTISDAHFQSYSPGVTVAAQLDLGDAIYKSLAAKQIVNASTHALESQRQETVLQAAKVFFDLTRASQLAEVNSNALSVSQKFQQQLHGAVQNGIAFKGDELRVETQTKQYQILLRQSVEQQRIATVELVRVLHLDPMVELVPLDHGLTRLTLVETNLSGRALVEQAMASRPELKQSDALVAAAKDTRNGAVYGPLIPSLAAQAFGGGLGGGPDGGPTHFGAEGDYLVGIQWRIGPGGLFDHGRVQASKSRLSQAELNETKVRDDIASQVLAELARVQSLSDQIELAEAKLAAATETLRVTRERKQYGVGIVLEDVQAQQDLQRARADYINAVADFNKAQFDLSRAIGNPQW